jgi:chromosome segregation ATPase
MKAKGHAIGRLIVSTVLPGILAALALGIAGCDDRMARMEENQIRLQAMVAANARQLATISSQVHVNNSEVQEGILKLDRNDRDLATGVSTVQNEQNALRETVTSANQAMDKRMATLDENQRLLRDGVGQVAAITQRTASDVTAIAREHATLHQMVQNSRRELGEGIAAVAVTGEKIRTDIGQLQQTDQRMVEQLVALATSQDRIYNGLDGLGKFMQAVASDVTGISQGQATLRQSLHEHNAALAEKSAILERNQQNIQAAVDGAAVETRKNTEGIAGLAAGQTAVQQTLGANHKIVTGQIAAVIENQQGLQAGINGLSERAGQNATRLTALATGQDAIRETLSNGNGVVAAKLAGLSESQTGLQSNLSGLHQKADTIVSNVTTIQAQQTSLHETLKANHEAAKNQVAQLSDEQEQLQGQLDVLTATAGQTALDVMALNDSSTALRQTVQASTNGLGEKADRIASGLTTMADRQTAMQQKIDAAVATTGQTARDVTAAAARQETIQQALQDHNETTTRQITGLAENGKRIQSALDTVTATTGQTALDVTAMATRQDVLRQTLQNHDKAVDSRMVNLVNGQEQIQNSLDSVTAMTSQTALDVINMAAGQDALTQNLRNHNEAVTSRITDLASSQQQTQSGVDTVVATSGQTALDMIDLSEGQAKLAQAVRTDRQELAVRLAELVQSQQQWAQRFDAAQANVQTIAANTTALEQHLTKLQGSLQPSLDGLTSQFGAAGQSRAQFEAKVNQDIQAIVDAVAQLRQDQASLTEQMQQIQVRTQSQTKDIITAIQQLKQPPAEVNVSDSGTKLESSVAEAAAK